MKYFIAWLSFLTLIASCGSNDKTATPGNDTSANSNNTTTVTTEVDSLQLDFTDTIDLSMDTLKDADIVSIKSDIAYNKYTQYLNELFAEKSLYLGLEGRQPYYFVQPPEIVDSKVAPFAKLAPKYPQQKNAYLHQTDQQQLFVFLNEDFAEQADSIVNTLDDKDASTKIILIDKLLKRALYMVDKSNFGKSDSINGAPIRTGIKYAWGGKRLDKKYNPTNSKSICNVNITGLDCSGFIHQLFTQTGVALPAQNANTLRDTNTLKKFLVPYFGDTSKITFADYDYKTAPRELIQSGDIIYFFTRDSVTGVKNAYHIGIALKLNNSIKLFHSSGGKNRCEYNISADGGIRCQEIYDYLYGKKNYGVVRIITREKGSRLF